MKTKVMAKQLCARHLLLFRMDGCDESSFYQFVHSPKHRTTMAALRRSSSLANVLRSCVCGGTKWVQSRHITAATRGEMKDVELKVTNFFKADKGTAKLAGDIFDVPIRKDIVHQVVRWQLAKRRKGTACTKTISEVSGTGKKPYKQKGTGRARHGTLRGPQFRHGATMHGPKPRDFEYKLNKKVRRLGLKIALSARVAERKLVIFDNMEPPSHKTREMVRLISDMDGCKKVLFVDAPEVINQPLKLATRNLHNANVIPAKGLNVYSILLHDTLVMTVNAVRQIEERLHTTINR